MRGMRWYGAWKINLSGVKDFGFRRDKFWGDLEGDYQRVGGGVILLANYLIAVGELDELVPIAADLRNNLLVKKFDFI